MTPFRSDRERRGAFAKQPTGKKARNPGPLTPAQRIDPKGILKSKLAQDLAFHDSVDLGGWLSQTELGADPLQVVALAMDSSFLYPDSVEELETAMREVAEWAELPWKPDHAQLRETFLHLEAQSTVLEYAIGHASRNLRYIAPQNVKHVVQAALEFLGDKDPVKGRVEDLTRYVESHHVPSFRERQSMDENPEGQ